MAAPKKAVDRVKLEADYRAGVKSLRALGKEYGLAASRITQLAEDGGWDRDLSAKIKARAEAKLNSSILNTNLNAERKATEKEVVEANAELQKTVILSHRTDIERNRTLANALLAELEQMTADKEVFIRVRTLLREGTDPDLMELGKLLSKVVGFAGRVDSHSKLVGSLKTLLALEREAFGIDKSFTEKEESVESAIAAIKALKAAASD